MHTLRNQSCYLNVLLHQGSCLCGTQSNRGKARLTSPHFHFCREIKLKICFCLWPLWAGDILLWGPGAAPRGAFQWRHRNFLQVWSPSLSQDDDGLITITRLTFNKRFSRGSKEEEEKHHWIIKTNYWYHKTNYQIIFDNMVQADIWGKNWMEQLVKGQLPKSFQPLTF